MWTGAGLIVVAAGVLAYGIHDLYEAGVVSGGLFSHRAFDISAQIPPGSWYGTLLKGTINFRPDPMRAEVIAWLAYLVITMPLFFRTPRPKATVAESESDRPFVSSI